MKFGQVANPSEIDFTLPPDHPQTKRVLEAEIAHSFKNIKIGCAKWNRQDLKNFYPRGTKDELSYYSTQFNSIELNATFYRFFPAEQFQKWHDKVNEEFLFFPKVPRYISHIKRLKDCQQQVEEFVVNLLSLKEKLGMVFLQMPENFHAKNIRTLEDFLDAWPREIPLGVELRHTDWHNDQTIANELNDLLMQKNATNIITDSAGRRDLLHMRLSTDTAFIRYVGANHESDYERLDHWIERIEHWHQMGLKHLYFFVHQNLELASPLLAAYFIEKFNKKFNKDIQIPKTLDYAR